MLGALVHGHALFELAQHRFDVLGERRALKNIEHAAHREQRVALALRDRDVAVGAILEACGGSAVDRGARDVDSGVLQRFEVSFHGALAHSDLECELGYEPAVLETAERVENLQRARGLTDVTAAIHGRFRGVKGGEKQPERGARSVLRRFGRACRRVLSKWFRFVSSRSCTSRSRLARVVHPMP
ncbi:MAG TPA: hypothetical protein VMJ10_26560 [Kofleriaceae bacterium]|nr:hypothetical protein [Kofleriaceae bacterium]